MKQLYQDLWQTSVEQPFIGLNTRAYYLQRNEGHVLFYNTGNLDEIAEISNLGGIAFQYLSHRHESGRSLATIKAELKSQLCADELESPYIDSPVDVSVSERQVHSSNIEIIPTPGHTSGGLCFYYKSPIGQKYLFTGDLLFQSNGRWATLVFRPHGGSAEKLRESLLTIRSLEPTVVICSAFVGDISVVEVSSEEWLTAIDVNVMELSQ